MGCNYNDNFLPFNEYINKKEFKKGYPVFLNIYDLNCLNYILVFFGLGIYHSTIEVYSKEYCFGPTKEDEPGFYTNSSGELLSKLNLKEKRYLGNTLYTENDFLKILNLESPFWMGRTYDPFVKNCNHFSYYISKILVNNPQIDFPVYINRICFFGKFFSCFYPPIKRLYGNLQKRITNRIRVNSGNFEINEINNDIEKRNFSIKIENSENTQINRNRNRKSYSEMTIDNNMSDYNYNLNDKKILSKSLGNSRDGNNKKQNSA